MLDRNENLANGEKEDGQDENEQQGAAVQTVSDPRQGDGGVLDTLGFPVRPIRGTKWVSGQMPGAMRQVADTQRRRQELGQGLLWERLPRKGEGEGDWRWSV